MSSSADWSWGPTVALRPVETERVRLAPPPLRPAPTQGILNLGASWDVRTGAHNVAGSATEAPEESVDLSRDPWPWGSGSIHEVHMERGLAALPDPEIAVAEVHRILRPGGIWHLLLQVQDPDLIPKDEGARVPGTALAGLLGLARTPRILTAAPYTLVSSLRVPTLSHRMLATLRPGREPSRRGWPLRLTLAKARR
ncbi:MAG: hypothetical protein R3185_02495 [Candidatus Thermoplasmatota archaeon]|nr:hypothetical protein [Candidatus Thermoplasmatota archaeon]